MTTMSYEQTMEPDRRLDGGATLRPTPEQAEAIRLFGTGRSLAIEALAGTGKTSTLVMLGESTRRRGQYVAFNRALVDEARGKFPPNVRVNTIHSLAFREVGKRYAERLGASRRVPGFELARRMGLEPLTVSDFEGRPRVLQPAYLASLCTKAVSRFCQSDAADIAPEHFPYVEGLDPVVGGRRGWATNRQLAIALLPSARLIWEDLQRPYGWATYRHEHYLKSWQLSGPVIDADFVLFDESQDTSPVMAAIVAAQHDAQRVYVGDPHQSIYEWMGAIDALSRVDVEARTTLSQSFRFGDAVAEVANGILSLLGAPVLLRGNPAVTSRVEPLDVPRAILTRTNAVAVTELLRLEAEGRHPALVGGGDDVVSFARAAQMLQATGSTTHPELAAFSSWGAVQAYVTQDPEGEDLRLLVRLVDQFGPDAIVSALTRAASEDRADVTISTTHKAKGREWSTVRIAGDFPASNAPTDLRLRYVAVTRARDVLDDTALPDLSLRFDD
jgi:hypothetical protein